MGRWTTWLRNVKRHFRLLHFKLGHWGSAHGLWSERWSDRWKAPAWVRQPCVRGILSDTQLHPTVYLLLKSEKLSYSLTWRGTDTQLELNCLRLYWLSGDVFSWEVITFLESGERWGACSWNLLEKCKTPITPSWIRKTHETAAPLDDYLPQINNIWMPSFQYNNTYSSSTQFFFLFYTRNSATHVAPSLVQDVFTGSEGGGENKCPFFVLTSFPGKQSTVTQQ